MADGTAEVQKQGQGARANDHGQVSSDDLGLIPDDLEDEGKSEDELWDEMDAADGVAPKEDSPTTVEDVEEEAEEAAAAAADEPEAQEPQAPAAPAADVWANATPEQQAAWKAAQAEIAQLTQYRKSNEGRVSALQLQINNLQEQSRRSAPPPSNQGQRAQDRGTAPPQRNGELANVAKEFPEVAKPFLAEFHRQDEYIRRQGEEIGELKRQISAIGLDRETAAVVKQTDLLLEAYPDALELADDPTFRPWVDQQPRHIREAVSRNANAIVDAEEAADVIGRFKAFREQQSALNNGSQEQDPGGDPPPGNPGKPLSDRRRRQLASSASIRGKGPGVSSLGIPDTDDEDAIWDAYDRLEAAEARRSA